MVLVGRKLNRYSHNAKKVRSFQSPSSMFLSSLVVESCWDIHWSEQLLLGQGHTSVDICWWPIMFGQILMFDSACFVALATYVVDQWRHDPKSPISITLTDKKQMMGNYNDCQVEVRRIHIKQQTICKNTQTRIRFTTHQMVKSKSCLINLPQYMTSTVKLWKEYWNLDPRD